MFFSSKKQHKNRYRGETQWQKWQNLATIEKEKLSQELRTP